MPQVKPVIEPQVKRVVVGVGPDKKSAVIHRDSPNHQEAFDMQLGSIKHVIDATVEAGGGSRMFRGELLETTA